MKRLWALALGVCLLVPIGAQAAGNPYTVAAVTVSNSSGLALAAGRRLYLAMLNQDAAKTVACSLGGTAVVNGAGSITLGPNGGGFVFDSDSIPADAINCIASASGAALTIIYVAP